MNPNVYTLLQSLHNIKLNPSHKISSNSTQVHFTEVVTLVRNHQVFLSRGWAFVQQCDIVHSVAKVFRSHLSKDLAVSWFANGFENSFQSY